MIFLPRSASRLRQREARLARNNRAEIVRALSAGQIGRRDLLKWGVFTATGYLALKNGLSPFATSAYAQVPTGTPRTPLYGARKFSEPLPRLEVVDPVPITRTADGHAAFPAHLEEPEARRLSWHTNFTDLQGFLRDNPYKNPVTGRGPMEGRPPGEIFAHQRWDEYFPKAGYVLSLGQCTDETYFNHDFPQQGKNQVWTFGKGRTGSSRLPPLLIKARYGEPMLTRIYNNLPVDRAENGGFGRNETQMHLHNAHNGAESDGAANVHHFPGTFYDYRWSTTLARADRINTDASDPRASGPDGNGGLVHVPGDYRELQSSLWFHDHRFFHTAENVYKGMLGVINFYSGKDRGHERLDDGVNLRLPSGELLDYGNVDFDVNLVISDAACDEDGQYFFDIFTTDGFLGDLPLVNFAYAPFMEVLPRKYRFRFLNACMSRFLKLALFNGSNAVPMQVIANDGNLLVNPVQVNALDIMGNAERFDVVIDFSQFALGERMRLFNLLRMRDDGRGPKEVLSRSEANKRSDDDPVLGPIMEFRVVGEVPSVDVPGVTHRATQRDRSRVRNNLTDQIPLVEPTRIRVVEFGRSGSGDSRGSDGECQPDCPEWATFPWTIKINGESAHSFNANRISMIVPESGDVEHWTYVNSGGGWDHPIHLHFEEGVTIDRGGDSIPITEKLARKDVWRLREGGQVKFQVQFGDFAGAYVNHCHNTVHEDFAMLLRYQILGQGIFSTVTPTPNPTPDGVFFTTPEILPEGKPDFSGGND